MCNLYFENLLENFVEDFSINEIDFSQLTVIINTYAEIGKKNLPTKADARKVLENVMSALHWYDFIGIIDFIDLDQYNDYILEIEEDNVLKRYAITLLDYGITIFVEWDID